MTIRSSTNDFSSSRPICLRVMFSSWNFLRSSMMSRVCSYSLILPQSKFGLPAKFPLEILVMASSKSVESKTPSAFMFIYFGAW